MKISIFNRFWSQFGSSLGPKCVQFWGLEINEKLAFRVRHPSKMAISGPPFFHCFFYRFPEKRAFRVRHPSKMALLNKPTKVHQLLKKTTIFALLRRCQLDFRLFHFWKISFFLHALMSKNAVLRGRQLDFRVSHISKNRCFFIVRILVAGIYAKPLK